MAILACFGQLTASGPACLMTLRIGGQRFLARWSPPRRVDPSKTSRLFATFGVFSRDDCRPILAINSLKTETDKGEQRGFANLLIGLFGTIRNPATHNPKVEWPMAE